jgi:hypothetical protein
MAFPIFNKLGLVDDGRVEDYKRVNHNFARLMHLPADVRPRFVYAHFLLPHEPYIFDEDGNYVTSDVEHTHARAENYIGQLKYTNRRTLELLDTLIAGSERPPVIILQADEGPYPPGTGAAAFQWESATRDQCREKTRILNAMYLPGVDRATLYPSITPVNTFRLVFDHYFGTDYGLLPDECYAYYDLDHL